MPRSTPPAIPIVGLPARVFVRHFAFGLLLSATVLGVVMQGPGRTPVVWAIVAANTALYPFARFAYERAVAFVVGDNLFVLPAVLFLFVKLLKMVLCWGFALFIAPVALLWLRRAASGGPHDAG